MPDLFRHAAVDIGQTAAKQLQVVLILIGHYRIAVIFQIVLFLPPPAA